MKIKKKFVLAMLISLIILIYFPFVNAACSLGASPLEMSANAKPGQTVEITWNFFNLRGDRPTHVLISKDSGPSWEISYSPAAENRSYEVSGIITNSFENFAMDKSEIVTTKPEPLPSGKLAYVVHPNSSLGYILVDKQMKILIEVPDDAKIGKQEEFKFEAVGKCFGETGSVSASLATELKVKITPSTEYYEKAVGEESQVTSLGKKLVDLFSGGGIKPVYMISTGITLILLIVLVVLVVLARRKQIKKGIKQEAKILGIRKKRK
jgi:heme exporter protein D